MFPPNAPLLAPLTASVSRLRGGKLRSATDASLRSLHGGKPVSPVRPLLICCRWTGSLLRGGKLRSATVAFLRDVL